MAAAVWLPLTANSGLARGARPRLGWTVPDWRLAAHAGPLRTFRIGAILQKRVRRRSSCAEPMCDRGRARPSAVVGRRGDGKESVRCRNGPSDGPSYRQHRVPGIWGCSRGLLGDGERVALPQMRHLQSGPRRVGLGFRQGGWDGISRGSGIGSRAPACSLWSAIAVTASRSSRATRGIEMLNPFIAHSGEAEGVRVYEKWTPSAI